MTLVSVVEDRGVRVAHDVGGDDRILGASLEHLELSLGGLDGSLNGSTTSLLRDEGEVGQEPWSGWERDGEAIVLPAAWQNQGDGLSSTGSWWDHVQVCGAGDADPGGIEDALVTRVGSDGRHDAALRYRSSRELMRGRGSWSQEAFDTMFIVALS